MSGMSGKRTLVDVLIHRTVVCALIITHWRSAGATEVKFDLQNYLDNTDLALMPRSNAVGSFSVPMKVDQYVEIWFCLPVEAIVTVADIVYSNDGQSDSVHTFIDDQIVGSFRSKEHSDWGHKWNEFISTGRVGEPRPLFPGFHKIRISVNETDEHGVELDTTRLNAEIPFAEFDDEEFLRCEKCVEQVEDDDSQNLEKRNTKAVLILRNLGLFTSEDGGSSIAIDMIPRPMVPFRAVAASPCNTVGSSRDSGSTTKGPGIIRTIQMWQTGEKDQSSDEFYNSAPPGDSDPDVFTFGDIAHDRTFLGAFNTSTVDKFWVGFLGQRFGVLKDEDGVSFIEISLVASQLSVNLSIQSVSMSGDLSPLSFKSFIFDSPTQRWEFPVSTWSTNPLTGNLVEIVVTSAEPTTVRVDFMRMYVETEKEINVNPVGRNTQEFVIDVRSDVPITKGPTMAVTGINNQIMEGVDLIKISVRANGGMALVPIFQLQPNGGITITSPLIGEFPPVDQRFLLKLAPHLSGIKMVSLDPTDLTLNCTFHDDSVVRLRIDATSDTATFTVLGVDLTSGIGENPFMRFETPWTTDVDNGAVTIVTNERNVNQLLTGWDSLEAPAVDFVNRCDSGERITRPDWKIELLG